MKSSIFSISIILAFALAIGAGYWSYEQYNQLTQVKKNIVTVTQSLNSLEQNEILDSEGALQEAKSAETWIAQSADIQRIFPPLPFKTDLYRGFEAFFESLNTSDNPMIVNSIQIPEPKDDDDLGASVVTVNLSIESTERNFREFMAWVENSGYIDPSEIVSKEKYPARLMTIESIQIQFPDELKVGENKPTQTATTDKETEKPKVETLRYNVTLNTYLQLQEI